MRLKLTEEEIALLNEQDISFDRKKSYSDFEILILSEQIYSKEEELSNTASRKNKDICQKLDNLSNKVSDFVKY